MLFHFFPNPVAISVLMVSGLVRRGKRHLLILYIGIEVEFTMYRDSQIRMCVLVYDVSNVLVFSYDTITKIIEPEYGLGVVLTSTHLQRRIMFSTKKDSPFHSILTSGAILHCMRISQGCARFKMQLKQTN